MNNQQSRISAQDFLDKGLFELMGLSHLGDEEKKELTKTISDTVENRVLDRLYELLKDMNKLEEYYKALEKGDPEFTKFFTDNDIDLKQMFLEEAMALRIQLTTAADLFDQGIKPTTKTDKD